MRAMDRTPKMHEGNMSHDVLGGAYEYLLKRFSDGSGTRACCFELAAQTSLRHTASPY
jgi:hypothetical protein